MVVIGWDGWTKTYTHENFDKLKEILLSSDIWITFNGKFDIHWIYRELGIRPKTVWDCQIAEFLFSNQTWKYPSLDESCHKHKILQKLDVVKTEYWEKGVDTPDIPYEILRDYAIRDAEATLGLFHRQVELFEGTEANKYKLFRVQCNDLMVLQEMEYNGILYDKEKSLQSAAELDKQVKICDNKLENYANCTLNFGSNQQISKLLYGGIIEEEYVVPIGIFKSGQKVGQVRYKKMIKEIILPRIMEPLEGTAMVAGGIYSVDADTLLKLKATGQGKAIVKILQERVKLVKLNSTYLTGLPKTLDKYDCDDNILHTTFNQCTVVSGRLSSTKPNVQNQPPEAKQFCISRF